MARTDPRHRNGGRRVSRAGLPPQLLRRGRSVPAPATQGLVARFLALLMLSIGVTLVSMAFFAYTTYAGIADSLTPRLDAVENRTSFENSRIYDRNGVLLYELIGSGRRTRIELSDISTTLISATVAIEDKSFFENQGIDYEGILRSVLNIVLYGEERGGGSTITQQLIKAIVLTDEERLDENRYQRKLIEIILAQELTQRFTKEEILSLYLNEIYYGNLAYGIQAASESYFDTSAGELSLAQAALLAGLPQLPTFYNPVNYADGNILRGLVVDDDWLDESYLLPDDTSPPKARQLAVLRRMVEEGFATEVEARRAFAEDLRLASQDVPLNAPHFVFYIRDLLEEQYGPQLVSEGGLEIYTTIDLELQRMVQERAAERIAELEQRNIHNAAVVVMQPNTGQILAMVGSIDYNAVKATTTPGEEGNVVDGQVNVATRQRQPGSALKPFTYLAAMERGMTPVSVLWDVPTKFPLTSAGTENYEPQNYNGRWNGPVRIRTALANSLNMPAVLALRYAGINNTIDLLNRLGIKQSLNRGEEFYGLALTLGGGEVSPLELTTAYNTLASNGRYYAPEGILRIVTSQGEVLEEWQPQLGPQVVDQGLVAIISDMLSDDQARAAIWGLNSKLKLSRPAAVKTGTSNDWRDAWTAGYTPYVTVGVWSGNNNNEPTAKVESLSGGGIIWHNVMEAMFASPRFEALLAEPYDGVLPLEFQRPESLQRRPICSLPGPFGGYNEEWFTPAMLNDLRIDTPSSSETAIAGPSFIDAEGRLGCDTYRAIEVIRLPGAESVPLTTGTFTDTGALRSGGYCLPQPGMSYAAEQVSRVLLWNIPAPDPDIDVEYNWSWGNAEGDLSLTSLRNGDLPACSAEMIATPTPVAPVPGAILMPDLIGYGQNQAIDALTALGIPSTAIYADPQDRQRAGEAYDRFVPWAVISSLPAPGEWWIPGTTIVLGIRAPDPTGPTTIPVAPTSTLPALPDEQLPPPTAVLPPNVTPPRIVPGVTP